MRQMGKNQVRALGVNVACLAALGWICSVANGIRVTPSAPTRSVQRANAVFAMGSFWRADAVFGCLPGVLKTRVGYCGGTKINPDYHGIGDHAECVEIEYDSSAIRYEQLLDAFWSNHDPSETFGQGPDVGDQYRSLILVQSDSQSRLANMSKEREQIKLGEKTQVTTTVQPLSIFYPATAEHQKFELRRNSTLLLFLGNLSDGELVASTAAAKLNGFAAGFCPKDRHKQIDSKVNRILKSRPELLEILEA